MFKTPKAIVHVTLEPDGGSFDLPRPKTARQLLAALDIMEETALVIRAGHLLTPDRHIWPEDALIVRMAGSRG